jgi:hypothetical protein
LSKNRVAPRNERKWWIDPSKERSLCRLPHFSRFQLRSSQLNQNTRGRPYGLPLFVKINKGILRDMPLLLQFFTFEFYVLPWGN